MSTKDITFNNHNDVGIQGYEQKFGDVHIYRNNPGEDKKYPIPAQLPYLPSSHFTGRKEIIEGIILEFWPEGVVTDKSLRRKEIILYGLPGAGKSQIALEYANKCIHEERYSAVFWMNADSSAELEVSAQDAVLTIVQHYERTWISKNLHYHIARTFNIVEPIKDHDELIEALGEVTYTKSLSYWLDQEFKPGWLLILDNFDDPAACYLDILARDVGHILVTSRKNNVRGASHPIQVPESIGEEESIELLKKASGEKFTPDTRNAALAVARSIGCLPLALDQIGAYLKKTQIPISQYEKSLNDKIKPHLDHVYAVWELSLNKLRQNPRELLHLLSWIGNKDIPLTLLQSKKGRAGWMNDDEAIGAAIGELLSLSFLRKDETGKYYMHHLLHQWARTQAFPSIEMTDYQSHVIGIVTSTIENKLHNTTGNRLYIRSILPHIDCCYKIFSESIPETGFLNRQMRDVAYNLVRAYEYLGDVKKATFLYERGLCDIENVDDLQDLDLQFMNSFGMNLCLRGRYEEALIWCRKALDRFESNDSPMALDARHHIADVYFEKGEYESAQEEYAVVLEAKKSKFGKSNPSTLKTRQSLAVLYRNINLYPKALAEFHEIYLERVESLGPSHALTLETEHDKAITLEYLGQYEDALELYRRVLKLQETSLGKTHYSTLNTMDSIASVFERMGKYNEALEGYSEVLNKLNDIFGETDDHPFILSASSGKADVLARLGRYREAEEIYQNVYTGYRRIHSKTRGELPTATNLGRVLREQGKYGEALQWFEKSHLGLELSGPKKDNSAVLAAKFGKATVLELLGEYEKALELYNQVLIGDREAGADDTYLLTTKCYIASIYCKQGKYQNARELYEEVAAGQKKAVGENHPSTLMAVNGLALVSEKSGDCDGALKQYRHVVEKLEGGNMKDHSIMLDATQGIGRTLVRKRKCNEGLEQLQEVTKRRKMVAGKDHPLVFQALGDVGHAYRKKGSYEEACDYYKRALEGCQMKLGENHPLTISVMKGLAKALLMRGHLVDFVCYWWKAKSTWRNSSRQAIIKVLINLIRLVTTGHS
ncbi:hypothetical protein F5884DRAFT_837500 [Xylogone sp. PMI_703]|nr:hypothetical protein F5884DRAFT_837500 [Xylogone sp. PMI_703]